MSVQPPGASFLKGVVISTSGLVRFISGAWTAPGLMIMYPVGGSVSLTVYLPRLRFSSLNTPGFKSTSGSLSSTTGMQTGVVSSVYVSVALT